MFEKLGKFQIKKLLGQGAMGEVYLGIDPAIGREVAIKTIIPTASQGDEAKARFEREARAAGVLNHPHLVTIYEFGEDQGVMFIAMEYVRGNDLDELFQDQSLSRSEALEVLAQICDGLNFAHRAGIVHRDIKPSNVRVTRDGKRLHAKVMDFGVARVSNSEMTATGMVMGTVSYMAPEYIRTGKPDSRSDLFAVGVMLYEILSGRKPFAGETTPTILYKIVNEPPDPIDLHSLAGISPAIRMVLDRALAKDPDVRFQTAEDLAKALRAAKDPTWKGEVEQATFRIAAGAVTVPVPEAALPPPPPAPVTVTLPSQSTKTPRRTNVGLILAASLGGLVLVAGGAFGAYRVFGTKSAPDPAVEPAAPSTENAATTSPVQSLPLPKTTVASSQAIPAPNSPTLPMPSGKDVPSENPRATQPLTPAPVAPVATPKDPKFSQEALGNMDVPERKNLSNLSLSEAIQMLDKDRKRALEGMLNATFANPSNPAGYAWAVAVLYQDGRYSEIPPILARARRNGLNRGQLAAANVRFRMAMQQEAMNRRIPGGGGGDE